MGALGQSWTRVEGFEKVTGAAQYAAEFHYPNLHYAAITPATIAAGRIASIDTTEAKQDPDVIEIWHYGNAPRLQSVPIFPFGPAGESKMPLQDEVIGYAGQAVALTVARTPEAARDGAARIRMTYVSEPVRVMSALLAAGADPIDPPEKLRQANDAARGDAEQLIAGAEVVQDGVYFTPAHNPNAMELGATVAVWEFNKLLLHDSTQWVLGVRNCVARALELPLESVRVVAPFVGGGFGSKCFVWAHTLLAAAAARYLSVPVQLVLTRAQAHQAFGLRPETAQQVTIGSDRAGRLMAIRHTSVAHTSVHDVFLRSASEVTEVLYDCPGLLTRNRAMRVNSCTPANMRAPAESYGSFALESSMDELAVRLKVDPLELRLRNLPRTHPEGMPWSSCSLQDCYEEGAKRFGWSDRPPEPRTHREADELVGWGMAAGAYGCYRSQAAAAITLRSDGIFEVRCATHEIGSGTRTLMAQAAADVLAVPAEQIRVLLGDTDFPAAPVHGASRTAASVAPAVHAAAREMISGLISRATQDAQSPLYQCPPEALEASGGALRLRADHRRADCFKNIMERNGGEEIRVERRAGPLELTDKDWATLSSGINTIRGPKTKNLAMYGFCAHFVEVRVIPELGSIRIGRVVTRAAAGRILNPKQAHSQLLGGVVFGIGMALSEQVRFDARSGRMLSASPTAYEIPALQQIPPLDLAFVEERDAAVNELGAKGVGELGLVGFAGAVANAFWHATGWRVRSVPISSDKILAFSEQ